MALCEKIRSEPNGFLVHHLNHSVTLSMKKVEQSCHQSILNWLACGFVLSARLAWRAPPAQSLPLQHHWP